MINTLITNAFIAAVIALGSPSPCPMPHVVFNSDIITHECQRAARHGYSAKACYRSGTQTIILRSLWNGTGDDLGVLDYEMRRHVTMSCLHKPFNPDNEDWHTQ